MIDKQFWILIEKVNQFNLFQTTLVTILNIMTIELWKIIYNHNYEKFHLIFILLLNFRQLEDVFRKLSQKFFCFKNIKIYCRLIWQIISRMNTNTKKIIPLKTWKTLIQISQNPSNPTNAFSHFSSNIQFTSPINFMISIFRKRCC